MVWHERAVRGGCVVCLVCMSPQLESNRLVCVCLFLVCVIVSLSSPSPTCRGEEPWARDSRACLSASSRLRQEIRKGWGRWCGCGCVSRIGVSVPGLVVWCARIGCGIMWFYDLVVVVVFVVVT